MTSRKQTGMLEAQALHRRVRVHCLNNCEGHLFDTHLHQLPRDILMPENFKCFSLNPAAAELAKVSKILLYPSVRQDGVF